MTELEEYKMLVAQRLNSIGEMMAKIALGDNSQKLDLFNIGDDVFGEFAFSLDTLIEDLVNARADLEKQRRYHQSRAEIWRKAATAYSTSKQVFEELLQAINDTYDIDISGFFIADVNEKDYIFISAQSADSLYDLYGFSFSREMIKIQDSIGYTFYHVPDDSPLFLGNPPPELETMTAVAQNHQLKSIAAMVTIDNSTKCNIALVLGCKKRRLWTDQEEQTIAALTYILFARYSQLRTQEKLKQHNENLEREVAKRTRELSDLNEQLTRDLEEKDEVRKIIQENMELYRTLFETIPDPIITITLDGLISNCNTAALIFFGVNSIKYLQNKPLNGFIKTHDLQFDDNSLGIAQEKELRCCDGIIRLCEITISDLNSYTSLPNTFKLCIIHDVTQQREHDKDRARIQSIESIGILAGGIAHDFNNILSGIAGNLYVASYIQNDNPQKSQELLLSAHNSIIKAKSLTSQLLTFAKGGDPVKELLDIEQIIDEAQTFALAGSSVLCQTDFQKGLSAIDGDRTQLLQVFTNLILNAVQATESGEISIGVEMLSLEDANVYQLAPGRYIHFSVSDRGKGISPEVAPYIFHPFFTTKENGTGLGLSVVYSVVTKHKGTITHEPRSGGGTTFNVYLPSSSASVPLMPVKEELVVTQHPKLKTSENRRLLVMDDDEDICYMAKELLTYLGYEPSIVNNGEEAIAAYQESLTSEQPYLAVFLDLTIAGGMGGKEAVRQLRAMNPQVFAIVVSGYSNDPVMANYKEYGFSAILAKPYTIEDLKNTLIMASNHGLEEGQA